MRCQPLTRLECTGQKLTFGIEKEQMQNPEKRPQKSHQKIKVKKRVCTCCKTDISHKRKAAVYCSKKCNNTINGIKRTQSRKTQRESEKIELQILLVNIRRTNYLLSITYKDNSVYTDTLFQSEILVTSSWLNTVLKVSVNVMGITSNPIVLNGYRAKSLIRIINNINTLNHEKSKKHE